MLYSDNGWLAGRGDKFEIGLLFHMFVLMIIGTPLAWHKVWGGVGIRESRCNWMRGWLADKIREKAVALDELREALGRLQFIAGPSELLRPFLGSLYTWRCAGNRFLKPRLPVMLLLILKFI